MIQFDYVFVWCFVRLSIKHFGPILEKQEQLDYCYFEHVTHMYTLNLCVNIYHKHNTYVFAFQMRQKLN